MITDTPAADALAPGAAGPEPGAPHVPHRGHWCRVVPNALHEETSLAAQEVLRPLLLRKSAMHTPSRASRPLGRRLAPRLGSGRPARGAARPAWLSPNPPMSDEFTRSGRSLPP